MPGYSYLCARENDNYSQTDQMKKFVQLALMAVLVFAATATVSAQKFGYVNSTAILADMPEVKAADSNLEGLQTQLQKKGQDMVKTFQADLGQLQQQAAAGTLSPKAQEEEAAKMETRRNEIQAFEAKMVNDLQEKRAELYEPILQKVNDAIKAVAEENEFTFIFDQQVLLYGQESQDVSALVRAKLGI